jgi:histidinol-phosphate aminotransferase
MYTDPENHDLRAALAEFHGVTPANIIVGEGIDGLLGYLVRLLIEPGDAVVTSDGAYPTFNFHVAGYGGTLHKVPYRGDHEDPAALVAKASETGAKLVYLANPDNPMGSWLEAKTLLAALDGLPEGCLLIVDEAYVDLAPRGTALRVEAEDPRVIVMRTFSKIYGLAGARVGYALGAAPLIAAFDKVRNHFGMNRIGQIGALEALKDRGWLTYVRTEVEAAKARIAAIGEENGLKPLPSATNFVTMDCGADGDFARAVVKALAAEGVFVRMPFVPPHDRCIRVSAGRKPDLDAFAIALPKALAAARRG